MTVSIPGLMTLEMPPPRPEYQGTPRHLIPFLKAHTQGLNDDLRGISTRLTASLTPSTPTSRLTETQAPETLKSRRSLYASTRT